jgi:hypothetical protein
METENPKQLLETFLVSASERKARSLRLIYDICEELGKTPSKSVTVANVGRISQERGGPGAPALRNVAGEHYRLLIQAFAKQAGGIKTPRAGKQAVLDEILEGVNDQVLRARISLLVAELSSCKAQILALRHLANQTSVLDLRGVQEPIAQASVDKLSLDLTLQEMTALEAAISPATLEHWGWTKTPTGRISSESGQIVFRAGFVSAVEKVIAFCGI